LSPDPSFGHAQLHLRLWERPWLDQGHPADVLPETEWRYFVIAFRGLNRTLVEIELAFDIAPLELEIGFTVMYHKIEIEREVYAPSVLWTTRRLFHVLEAASMNAGVGNNSFFVSVSSNEIDEVNLIQSQLQQHDARLLDVRRLAAQLGQMKGFPHNL
jgi:hypothetical protein